MPSSPSLTRSLGSGAVLLNTEPLVASVDSFCDGLADDGASRDLVEAARERLGHSKVSGPRTGFTSPGRTSTHAWLAHDVTPRTRALAERIAKVVLRPLSTAEAFQVVRYGRGGEYRAHFDAYDLGTERGRRTCRGRGQRLLTAIVYLNDVEAGGATSFPRLGLSVQARAGRLLVFENCGRSSTVRHGDALHAGEPVLAGEKWIANLWFRERAPTGLNARDAATR